MNQGNDAFIKFLHVEFNMSILGSDAAERTGLRWTVSHEDHPARAVYRNVKKAPTGWSTIVALSKKIVSYREGV